MKVSIFGFSRKKWSVLSATSLGSFMVTLNVSNINIALPSITQYYQTNLSTSEWIILIYLLLLSSLLLTYGRLGDMYGYKPVYTLGFTVFTAASFFICFAPSVIALIVLRALQAVGAGMVISMVQAIIADSFDQSERGEAIGLNTVFVSLGLATGPTLGGLLIHYYGWQSIFLLNVPVGIIGTLWAWHILSSKEGQGRKFDIAGAVTLFLSLMSFLLATSHGQSWGWLSWTVIGLFLSAGVLLAVFYYLEKHVANPMINLRMFQNRIFTAANIAGLFCHMTQYTVVFLMPFYLIDVLKMSSQEAGFILMMLPLMMMVTSPVSGALNNKIDSRILASAGMGIVAAGAFYLGNLGFTAQSTKVSLGLALFGLGTGLFVVTNSNTIMGVVPKEQAGIASGMIAMTRSIGQALGVAVSGAILASRTVYYSVHSSLSISPEKVFIMAQRDTLLAAVALAMLGMFFSLVKET